MENPRKKNRSSRKLNRDAFVTDLQEEKGFGKPSITQKTHPKALLKTAPVRKLATTKPMSKEGDYSSKVDLNHWTLYEIDYNDINDADESTLPWEKLKLLVKLANLADNDHVIGDVMNEAPAFDGTVEERLVTAYCTGTNKNRNKQLAKATDVVENDRTLMSCRSRRKREPKKRSSKEETASPAGCKRGRKTDGTSTSPLKKKSKPTKATLVSDKKLAPLKAQRVASKKSKPASSSSQRKSLKRSNKKDPVVEPHISQELDRSVVEEAVQVPQRIERIWTPLDHLLQSPLGLLSMDQGGITVVESTASSKPFFLFPPALEVNPAIANAPPGSLILVPSNDGDPANQMVHVYRIPMPSELLPN